MSNAPAKLWCFTCNNPSISKEELVEALRPFSSYIICGDELGATQTPHFQGYLELINKLRFAQVKKLFPEEAVPHLEKKAVRSTREQASNYCKKDGNFLEAGVLGPANKKNKSQHLITLTDLVIEGNDMASVAMEHPPTYVRNYRGLAALQTLTTKVPNIREMHVYLFYGVTGSGKTHTAFEVYPDLFKKPIGKGLWFDGYERDKEILIDEFQGQWPLSDVLQIMDIYKCQVEVKCGHRYLFNNVLILTTNLHPAYYYESWVGREEHQKAFIRRIEKVFWFKTLHVKGQPNDIEEIDDRDKIYDFCTTPPPNSVAPAIFNKNSRF